MEQNSVKHNRRYTDPHLLTLSERIVVVEQTIMKHIADEEITKAGYQAELRANTALTQQVANNTAGIVEAWTAIAGGLKVLGFLAKLAKWLTAFTALAASAYALFHVADVSKDINPGDFLPKGPPK